MREMNRLRTPEFYEKRDIKKHLDSMGAFYFSPYMSGYGKTGIPDITVCYRGTFIGIEVKREGKEPTARQWKILDEIRAAGGVALCGTAEVVIAGLKQRFGDSVLP